MPQSPPGRHRAAGESDCRAPEGSLQAQRKRCLEVNGRARFRHCLPGCGLWRWPYSQIPKRLPPGKHSAAFWPLPQCRGHGRRHKRQRHLFPYAAESGVLHRTLIRMRSPAPIPPPAGSGYNAPQKQKCRVLPGWYTGHVEGTWNQPRRRPRKGSCPPGGSGRTGRRRQ